ncbi:MAG: phosphate/phosphite/phosphonate ABC transporter substrate-binding protein [Deltaproteobacteria bacterium]|nr:phosphate/phosphite/phosphonate ABC transporter substrate-binding protein [Deltaproteobacteria bacterium]MBW2543228.1 phosphate/phosphite/phosphonate ABC transporter substrate-binding protein [Deltaproteobacteria bacterium]
MSFPSADLHRRILSIAVLALVAFAMGCADQQDTEPENRESWPTIRIGLIPERNIFSQKQRYQPIAEYLSERVHANVELVVLSRYGNIIENFVSNRLDGAFFGSFTGALAHRKLHVEAIARPEYPDGTSTYHGLLLVRKDSGITDIEDMRGKRFAFVDKATTAGYLLPLYYFKTHGIDDPESFLKETYFAGTHDGVINDLLERKTDIGAAKNTVFAALVAKNPRVSEELTILTRSPDVPENALCVRADLDESIKNDLRIELLSMDQNKIGKQILSEFGAARFIDTTEADYNAVFEYADTIGLDLETYDYLNF